MYINVHQCTFFVVSRPHSCDVSCSFFDATIRRIGTWGMAQQNPGGVAGSLPESTRDMSLRFSGRSASFHGYVQYWSIFKYYIILWLIMFPGKKWKQTFGKTVVSISMLIEGYPFWWGHWPNLFNWILLRSRNATSKRSLDNVIPLHTLDVQFWKMNSCMPPWAFNSLRIPTCCCQPTNSEEMTLWQPHVSPCIPCSVRRILWCFWHLFRAVSLGLHGLLLSICSFLIHFHYLLATTVPVLFGLNLW